MKRLGFLTLGLTALGILALTGCGSEPPRVPFPTASTAAGPVAGAYQCNSGAPLSVTVAPDGTGLSYAYAGYPHRPMTQTGGGTYSDGTYQLKVQGSQVQLSHASTGQPFDFCTRTA